MHGNNYILIEYSHDANVILAKALKDWTEASILKGYNVLHQRLVAVSQKPTLQILGNEISKLLVEYHNNNDITIKLAPSHMHQ